MSKCKSKKKIPGNLDEIFEFEENKQLSLANTVFLCIFLSV